MRIKKLLAVGTITVMSTACLALPAFAHGHHRQTQVINTCPAVCTVDGCAETGRHAHNGVTYCGYNHSSGYCDGSCVTVNNSNTSGCYGHHGCH